MYGFDAFSVIDDTPEIEAVIGWTFQEKYFIWIMLSYHSSKLGGESVRIRNAAPTSVLTYPRPSGGLCVICEMGYADVDPFAQGSLPPHPAIRLERAFNNERARPRQSFLADAAYGTVSGSIDFPSQSSASMGIVVTLEFRFHDLKGNGRIF